LLEAPTGRKAVSQAFYSPESFDFTPSFLLERPPLWHPYPPLCFHFAALSCLTFSLFFFPLTSLPIGTQVLAVRTMIERGVPYRAMAPCFRITLTPSPFARLSWFILLRSPAPRQVGPIEFSPPPATRPFLFSPAWFIPREDLTSLSASSHFRLGTFTSFRASLVASYATSPYRSLCRLIFS